MPLFFTVLAKKYNPYDIDNGMFAMNCAAPRSLPIVCTKMIADDGYGTATVNGKAVSKGKCVKFDFSPLPIYLLPVGEAAQDFDKTYTVKLSGYRDIDGRRFSDCTFKIKTPPKPIDDGLHKENEQAAKEVSDEGIVLLENNGILPLGSGSSIKLLGAYNDFRITAIGASLIKPRWTLTVPEAVEHSGALSIRDNAETALFFISRGSGENKDNRPIKGEYYLTDEEKAALSEAAAKYKNLIIILNTGYPIEMGFIRGLGASAVIWTGFSGQRGSESLIDILCGKVNPSGRLADTWPIDYYDSPSAKNFINLDDNSPIYSDDGKRFGASVYYEEQEFVGYRYFDSFKKDAAYYFGRGLSYSDFSVRSSASFENGILRVSAEVTNNSDVPGKDSVLVYVKPPRGNEPRPAKLFCGFEKTALLKKGERQTLTIDIPQKDFSHYDKNLHAFILSKGQYDVMVGGEADKIKTICSFVLEDDVVCEKTVSVCREAEKITGVDENGNVRTDKTKITEAKKAISVHAEYTRPSYNELPRYRGSTITLSDVKEDLTKLDDFVSQFSLRDLADFTVCNGSCWGPGKSGAAGKLASSKRLGVPTLYMSDGNCCVNLNRPTTGFPSSNLLAGTFNKSLAYKVGKVLADESKENGISINLGPGGNLHRNILCGRHPEYYSEDPILTGTLMAYQARGLEENGVIATYKHLIANNMEFERKSAHGIIDENTLRDLYLRVFDKAFSLYKPGCVMTSYNPVNGIYPCENSALLNDLLRGEWGFDGFVMTDWGSYDTADSIRSVCAGTNLLTPGSKKHFRMILKAVKRNEISKAALQHSVKQIVKVLVRCI